MCGERAGEHGCVHVGEWVGMGVCVRGFVVRERVSGDVQHWMRTCLNLFVLILCALLCDS